MENVQKKKIDFTEGKVFFKLLRFILPIVATNLLQMFYNAADMMVVSLSHEQNAVGAEKKIFCRMRLSRNFVFFFCVFEVVGFPAGVVLFQKLR